VSHSPAYICPISLVKEGDSYVPRDKASRRKMCDISKAYSGSCFESASGGASIPSPMGRQAPAMDLPPRTVPPYMSPQAPMQTLQPMPAGGTYDGRRNGNEPAGRQRLRQNALPRSQCPGCQTSFTATAVQGPGARGRKGGRSWRTARLRRRVDWK